MGTKLNKQISFNFRFDSENAASYYCKMINNKIKLSSPIVRRFFELRLRNEKELVIYVTIDPIFRKTDKWYGRDITPFIAYNKEDEAYIITLVDFTDIPEDPSGNIEDKNELFYFAMDDKNVESVVSILSLKNDKV